MMKKCVLVVFASTIVAMLMPATVKATETFKNTNVSYIKEQENGEYCIDLDEVYKYVNNESKVFTGADNGIDASKKANTISALVNLSTILGGSDGFCIKDKEAAINAGLLKHKGILGLLNSTNNSMMAYFPTISVVDHLAQTFVPGYAGNNATMAQTNSSPKCETSEKFCEHACTGYNTDVEPQLRQEACPWNMCENPEEAMKNVPTKDDCKKKCRQAGTKCEDDFVPGYSFMTLAKMDTNFTEEEVIELTSEEERVKRCNSRLEADKRIVEGMEKQMKESFLSKLKITDPVPGDPVYKSGKTGYSYLKDDIKLDKMWSQFRNMAYLLYVVILIVIGFMIMFRNKIGGQLMVSISNSIPQLILGLVLITFSFAIVGLALDVGKVLMVVSSKVFENLSPKIETQYIDTIHGMSNSAVTKINEGTGFRNLFDECTDMYKEAGVPQQGNGMGWQITKMAGGAFFASLIHTVQESHFADATSASSWIKLAINLALEGIKISVLLVLIYNTVILLVSIYAAFKLFITMFTTYIKIFMNVVLAPLQILAGSIPGNSAALTNWFKSVFANVLVFPVIFIIINFAIYLGENIETTENFNFFGNSGVLWPSLVANLKGVLLIGAYIFCSNIPGVINGFLKVGVSKELSTAGESTKKALGKLPLIGGIFG